MTSAQRLRIMLVFFGLCAAYGTLLVSLFSLQITHHARYTKLAHNQYSVTVVQHPPRAEIYDRRGTALALNQQSYALFITPSSLHEPEKTRAFLKKHFPDALPRLESHRTSHFLYVKRRLTDSEIAHINKSGLEDLHILNEPCRMYPMAATSPIIGMTDIDNHGIAGIELVCDTILAGSPTTYAIERDARSGHCYWAKETRVAGTHGSPVTLTIDADLQFMAYEELKTTLDTYQSKEGAVLIMDPSNGEILVAAHMPDCIPSPHQPCSLDALRARPFTDAYELGSVMKAFLALALVAENAIDPEEVIDCENVKTTHINNWRINTWKAQGLLSFSEVIEQSNNIGTSKLAVRLGTKLYDHYRRCGFGEKTGITFPGEHKGRVNHPSTWSKPTIFSLSFGYELSATLLQLACGFSLFARDGYPVTPKIILSPIVQHSIGKPTNTNTAEKRLYSHEAISTMRDILQRTVDTGTARRAHIDGYTIMGKTGTANLLVDGHYEPTKNIFTFVGLVERDMYQRIIVVFVKEACKKDIYASTVAVPLFERIAHNMLIHEKVL